MSVWHFEQNGSSVLLGQEDTASHRLQEGLGGRQGARKGWSGGTDQVFRQKKSNLEVVCGCMPVVANSLTPPRAGLLGLEAHGAGELHSTQYTTLM